MASRVLDRYRALVTEGRLERDPAQERIAARLDRLASALEAQRLARKSSALGWLFGARAPHEPTRGLYIWGSVGRGKTMLMDLFHEGLAVEHKRRVHFHAFMADVHERIHAWRQDWKAGRAKGEEPIAPVAASIAVDARVLCFDEFSVSDIADAMILSRLFEALFRDGVVVVATSNIAPENLYAGGLNRALFEPFIPLLESRMDVVSLHARTDYRLEKLGGSPVFLTPDDEDAARGMDETWARLTAGARPKPATLPVKGRTLSVPQAASGAARIGFDALCRQPLGAGDYLALARTFPVILLEHVPVIRASERNEAKRFINLIDVLYESHTTLVVSAAAPPEALYEGAEGREAFEWERTVSRLVEMQSQEYLAAPRAASKGLSGAGMGGIVET